MSIDPLNSPPNAPTLLAPVGGVTINRGAVQRLSWTFSDPDAGDSQSKYDLRYRLVGAGTWTTRTDTTPSRYWDAPANTFAAGNYEWQVYTYDSQGLGGSWSASSYFTAAAAAPAGPAITSPSNGATVDVEAALIWSTPSQTLYEVHVLNGSTEVFTTGQVSSPTTRQVIVPFPTNNVTRTIEVRVQHSGLWSTWSSITVTVSYTPPPAPVMYVTDSDATGSLTLAITNPGPSGSQPDVVSNEVWINDGDGAERRAVDAAPNGVWTYWTPVSDRDYSEHAYIVAVGDNGTTTRSG